MNLIKINQSSCIKCGICTKVCPSRVLSMEENGPQAINPKSCIACGQCVAVCPQGAIDNVKTPLSNQVNIKNFPTIDSHTAEQFLRSRIFIRCYKNTPVPQKNLLKLVDIAHFAPTASNTQGLSYIIVENKKTLDAAIKVIIEWMDGAAA